MKEGRLNSWIWKVNGIFIFLAGIGVIILLLNLLYDNFNRAKNKPEVVKLAKDPTGIEKWTLGRSRAIFGTDTLMLSLVSENSEVIQNDKMSMFSGGIQEARSAYRTAAKNILFIDMQQNSSHWLFESTSQLVLSSEEFPHRYREKKDQSGAQVVFYRLVVNDTNGDKILNHKDKLSLGMSDTTGQNYRVIIEEMDRIISTNSVKDGKIMLVYQNKGIAYSMLFAINPYKQISVSTLPKIE